MANPLYELMARGESGAAGYNAFNRGTYQDASGRDRIRPGTPPTDFSRLTVGELQDLQHLPRADPQRVFAVGKYQIIPSTMDEALSKLRVSRDVPFSPELQDRIFTDVLLRDKRPEIHAYITGAAGATLEQAQYALAKEWASFGDPYQAGRSHYGGANRAHITLEQSASALEQLRDSYRRAEAQGASRDEAWHAATAITPEQRTLAANSVSSDGLLRQGMRGEAVHALQADLARFDYPGRDGRPLTLDGVFGPETQSALRAYQRDHGLAADGIAGPATLASIGLQRYAHDRAAHVPPQPPVGDLIESIRHGVDAIREATERLQQSQAGQQWQRQVDAAATRPPLDLQCDPARTSEVAARAQ